MRIIGIDASLSSTAVCVMDEDGLDEFHCFVTEKLTNKWMIAAENYASLYPMEYGGNGAYSDSEVEKLRDYRNNAYKVVECVDIGVGDQVFMEGYANRAKGNIVDLVVFGTFLRERIIDSGAKLKIVTPMSLKKAWADAIYPKDKKGVARNYEIQKNGLGIAGGSFKKHQMMQGLFDLKGDFRFKTEMEMHAPDMMPLKNLPKPFDDCVDAFAAAYLGKIGYI